MEVLQRGTSAGKCLAAGIRARSIRATIPAVEVPQELQVQPAPKVGMHPLGQFRGDWALWDLLRQQLLVMAINSFPSSVGLLRSQVGAMVGGLKRCSYQER